MRTVWFWVFTHECSDPDCRYKRIDYEIRLTEKYAEITLITFAINRNPYRSKVVREYLLPFLLSLKSTKKNWKGIGNMQIEDFITLASYIFPDDYHARLQSLEMDEVPYLEDFVKLLHPEHNAGTRTQVSGWKGLMVKRGPAMFRSYNKFYNPFWFDYRNKNTDSKLIESSSGKVEEFLNMLYEINPEIIKRYIEKVEIDENEPEWRGCIYLDKKLKRCIKQARWSREIDLISASDTIRYCLKYDKSCIEKLAEELKTEVRI
jgi:hypothetical protein